MAGQSLNVNTEPTQSPTEQQLGPWPEQGLPFAEALFNQPPVGPGMLLGGAPASLGGPRPAGPLPPGLPSPAASGGPPVQQAPSAEANAMAGQPMMFDPKWVMGRMGGPAQAQPPMQQPPPMQPMMQPPFWMQGQQPASPFAPPPVPGQGGGTTNARPPKGGGLMDRFREFMERQDPAMLFNAAQAMIQSVDNPALAAQTLQNFQSGRAAEQLRRDELASKEQLARERQEDIDERAFERRRESAMLALQNLGALEDFAEEDEDGGVIVDEAGLLRAQRYISKVKGKQIKDKARSKVLAELFKGSRSNIPPEYAGDPDMQDVLDRRKATEEQKAKAAAALAALREKTSQLIDERIKDLQRRNGDPDKDRRTLQYRLIMSKLTDAHARNRALDKYFKDEALMGKDIFKVQQQYASDVMALQAEIADLQEAALAVAAGHGVRFDAATGSLLADYGPEPDEPEPEPEPDAGGGGGGGGAAAGATGDTATPPKSSYLDRYRKAKGGLLR